MKNKEEIIKTLDDFRDGKILTSEVACDKIFKVFRQLKRIKPRGFKRPRDKHNNIWGKLLKKIHDDKNIKTSN